MDYSMVTPQECMKMIPKPPEEFIKEIDEFLLEKFRGKPKQFYFPFGTPKETVILIAKAYHEASWCVYIGKGYRTLLFAAMPITEEWMETAKDRLTLYDPASYKCQI
jgi:hypothetical protein